MQSSIALRRTLAVTLPVVAIAAALLWLSRERWTAPLLFDALRARGVPVHGRVDAIGSDGVTVRDLVLGDPARPDLTAARGELVVRWDGLTPQIVAARLLRPVLHAAVDPRGRVRLGTLDRLRPPPDGKPARLPDLDVTVIGGRVEIATPYGMVRATVDGRGNPAGRFAGGLTLQPATLRIGPCRVPAGGGRFAVRAERRVGSIAGAFRIGAFACRGAAMQGASFRIAARLPDPLASARGTLVADLDAPTVSGGRADHVRLAFGGTVASDRVTGRLDAIASNGGTRDWRAPNAVFGADVRFDPGRPELRGVLRLEHASLAPAARARLSVPTAGLDATPLGPLEVAARAALARAAADFAATATVGYRASAPFVDDADVRAADGAWATVRRANDRSAGAATRVAIGGGGLPVAELTLSAPGRGVLRLDGFAAGAARLAPAVLAVTVSDTGLVTIVGPLALDGPFAQGRVDGLTVPSAAIRVDRDPFALSLLHCLPVTARRVSQPSYVLRDVTLTLCPTTAAAIAVDHGRLGGGFAVTALRAQARVGARVVALEAGSIAVALGGTVDVPVARIAARAVRARPATGAPAVDIGAVDAVAVDTPAGWRATGRIADARFAPLPVALGPVSGAWSMTAAGTIRFAAGDFAVAATGARPSVQPLRLTALTVGYRDGIAHVEGNVALADPVAPLARFTGDYRTATGVGTLDAQVDLAFTPALQPFQLSERARGVIENVAGRVEARAHLVVSGGKLAGNASGTLDRLSFATASLGPVRDVSGTLRLPDLTAVRSLPGQAFTIGSVNPGVAFANGVARVQLLSATRLRIEQLQFPFVGGNLSLVPVTIDATIPDRRFTLAARGLDVSRLVDLLKVHDLDATGVFDGTLPIVLSNRGARIEHGVVAARAPGGRLRYVGPVGNDLPQGAQLAFAALRALNYKELRIGIDGDLGGELVSDIAFTGSNEVPLKVGKTLPSFAAGVPFRFGLRIHAPFRALLGTAADLDDPASLVDRAKFADPR